MSRAVVRYQQPAHPEPEQDVDFSVSIKVRNGRFLAAIRKAGFRSVNAFCKTHGLPQRLVNCYATMTRSPYRGAGDARGQPLPLAQTVADLLGVQVDDMFPPRFLATCLDRIARSDEVPMTEGQIGMLLQQPPQTPEDVLALDEAARTISDTMILLPPREERLLRLRHGMGARNEETLEEVGQRMNVTRERIRQMETHAVAKLARPHAKGRLADATEAVGLGYFRLSKPRRSPTAASEAYIRERTTPLPPPKPVLPVKPTRPRKPRLPRPELPMQPLARPRPFPLPAPPREPDYIRLLRIPTDERSDEQKRAIAYHLEAEFGRRGAGSIRPADPNAAAWLNSLDQNAVQMEKYNWFMANLRELWRHFPPAPSLW